MRGKIAGLDYNSEMLKIARKNIHGDNNISIDFVRANAMKMTCSGTKRDQENFQINKGVNF